MPPAPQFGGPRACPHALSPVPQEELRALAWGSPCQGPRLGAARGGRVVVIVLDSADLDSAAAAIAASAAAPSPLVGPGGPPGGLGRLFGGVSDFLEGRFCVGGV